MTNITTSQRIPFLDGLRAVSISAVLASHQWAAGGSGAGWIYSHGDLGVRIFFLISGFLITTILLSELRETGRLSLRSFYVKRCARLVPVYIVYLAVIASIQLATSYNDSASSWIGAVTYTRNVIGNGRSLTGHLWSLSVEEQFYALLPLLILLGHKMKTRGLAAAFFILAILAVFFRSIPIDLRKL